MTAVQAPRTGFVRTAGRALLGTVRAPRPERTGAWGTAQVVVVVAVAVVWLLLDRRRPR